MSSPTPPFVPPSASPSPSISTSPQPPSSPSTSSFATSSHYHHWILTPAQLSAKRQAIDMRVRNKMAKALQGCTQEEKQSLRIPTLEQQQQLLLYYGHTLLTVMDTIQSKNVPISPTMFATTLHYFFRFYLSRSILEYHPIIILYTCLYLAGKTEENYLAIERLTDFLSLSRDWCPRIIKHEPVVLDAIHFHLRIYHPYRAVRGILNAAMDIEPAVRSYVKTLTTRTHELLEHVLFTDTIFHYVPAQIAAAAVIQASTELKFDQLTPRLTLMLQSIAKQQHSSFPEFSDRLTQIRSEIVAATEATVPDVAQITPIDRDCKMILGWITKRQKLLEEKKKKDRAQLKSQQRKERQAAAEAQTAALLGSSSLPKQATSDDDTDFLIRKRPRMNPDT